MSLRYFYILFFAVVIFLFYVWQQTQSMRLGYTVDALSRECEKLALENKNWELKVSCLLSMDRLDKVAKERKLTAPCEKNIIYLAG